MKFKLVNFVFLILLLLYFNYFYCLFLARSGELFSIKYQIFLIGIFFINSLFSFFINLKIKSFHIIFISFNFLSIFGSIFYINIFEELAYFTTTVLMPILFISTVSSALNECNIREKNLVIKLFIYYFILRGLIYLVLIPLELTTSDKYGFHNLQFTGGQYHNIAIFFILLLVVNYLNRISKGNFAFEKFITWILLLATVLFSFSRVGIILLLFYILLYLVLYSPKKIKHITLSSIVLFVIFQFFNFEDNLFFSFWQNRLNIVNGDLSSLSVSNVFNTDEGDDIRGIIRSLGFERNIFEFLFGTGIGTTPNYLNTISNGLYQFGSFHNLFITILYERGFFVFLFVSFYFLKLFKIFLNFGFLKTDLVLIFLLFVIFVNTTGAELFLNSRDFNIDLLLCLLFLELIINKFNPRRL